MADFTPVGLTITAQIAKCAHHCRFCLLNERATHDIAVDSFVAVVEKFIAHKNKTGFEVKQWFGNSYNFPLVEFAKLVRLFFKNGYNQPGAQDLRYIFLGGLPIMGKKELRAWLAARRELGCLHVAATYCGVGSSHDYNCSCAGHFNFQTKAQSIAADLGMSNLQRIIITSANLPQLNELLVKLNAVGHESTRQAFLMFYNGRGKLFENERPTLRQLLKQTPAVQELYRKNLADWKTEDGWAKALFVGKEFRQSDRIALRITAENIASLKDMSCEDLILDLTERTRCVYADIPSRQELAADYSDKANPKLYMTSWDVERLWLDRFMVKNPHISIDHSLLHFCL